MSSNQGLQKGEPNGRREPQGEGVRNHIIVGLIVGLIVAAFGLGLMAYLADPTIYP